jgi:ribose transport system permease protein
MATEAGHQPDAAVPPPGGGEGGRGRRAMLAARTRRGRLLEGSLLPFAWVLVIVGFGAAEPSAFLSVANFSNIFGSNAVLFVLTLALLVPLTNGDIDLSVGAVSGLVSMVVIVLNVQHHVPIALACLAGLAVGVVIGLVNGFVVIRFNVNSFIITLGTGTVAGGLIEWISSEQTITGVSPGLTKIVFTDEWLGIPLEFYIGVVIMLAVWYLLTFTPFGQRALFVGQSREVARLSGFRVSSVRFQGFLIAGLVAAISGILFVGTTGSASPGDGLNLLLPAYAAAFLGVTTIQPGRFNAIGSGISVYFLATGVAGLELFGAQDYVQSVFYGGILVIAVVISGVLSKRRYGAVDTT